MKGYIPVEELHRMAYNAKLFANRKRTCKGYTLWIQGANSLRVVSTNDYVILTDTSLKADMAPPSYQVMPPGNLQLLEKELRSLSSVQIDLENLNEYWEDNEVSQDLLTADEIALSGDDKIFFTRGWATNPEDVAKLSLVKTPPGEWPLDVEPLADNYGWCELHFKIGPTVKGVIATLDREAIREEYGFGMFS